MSDYYFEEAEKDYNTRLAKLQAALNRGDYPGFKGWDAEVFIEYHWTVEHEEPEEMMG